MDTAPSAQAPKPETRPKLIVRNAAAGDVRAVVELSKRVYKKEPPYTLAQVRGQITAFPDGVFVATYDKRVVGYCATFRVAEALAFSQHTWSEITGGGFSARHDPQGDYLYGMEVCVDPEYQGLRIGQRLYNARKALCQSLELKGIVFGGRLPGLSKRRRRVEGPEDYIKKVLDKSLRDPVLNFQIRNGFEVIGLLKRYNAADRESLGHAAHLLWRNPKVAADAQVQGMLHTSGGHLPDRVRVGTVQYQLRQISTFEEFAHQVEYFVDVVSDYNADFIVFPEMFTLQLLSIDNKKLPPNEAIAELTKYTKRLRTMLSELAVSYNINIIGGSHPTKDANGRIMNLSLICLRDGSVHEQAKIHPTPNETYWWNIQGGTTADTVMTDCGPIGVLICYDCEFPELARHLIDQGALILFVPFCTDERQSYLRVRYCAQARAVENQCYVVMSGNVGNLPNVENMDIQYAQSCVLTPCDFPFDRDGIAADTTPNVEMVAFADLSLQDLLAARASGTVLNLRDRRFDLYGINWTDAERH